MGLAATQARLLFITARQNDVSAKMQKVSNDTLILARDKEEIATNYDKMVNNQSYTYTNTDGTNISYDALMGETAAVNGITNIITDGNKRVVLSQSLASKLGLTQPEGTAKDFKSLYPNVEALINVAEPEAAEKINAANATEKGQKTGTLSDADKSNLASFKSAYGEYPTTTGPIEALNILGKSTATISGWTGTNNDNTSNGRSYNLYDLAKGGTNGDIVINLADDNSADGDPHEAAASNLNTLAKSIIIGIAKAMGITDTTKILEKLQPTLADFKTVVYNLDNKTYRKGHYSDVDPIVSTDIKKSNNLVIRGCADSGTDRDYYKVNASLLVRFLFERIMRLYGSADASEGSGVSRNGGCFGIDGLKYDAHQIMSYTTNSRGYTEADYLDALDRMYHINSESDNYDAALEYLGKKSTSEPTAETPDENSQEYYDNLKSYYTTLWNQLSTKGWTTQSAETIQENLNKGLYYISNRQMSSSNNFKAVGDPTVNTKADAYYDREMAKLNMKEKQLDTKLQKLQTEYSALTTDLESVKSILNANIQKSFVYCQNG